MKFFQFSQELRTYLEEVGTLKAGKKSEVSIYKNIIRRPELVKENMIVEDLAALDKITEERILDELQFRMEKGDSYTFVGDVLLSLNSNEIPTKYTRSVISIIEYLK